MNKKFLGYSLFFVVLVIVFLLFVFRGTNILSQSILPQRGTVQNFSFTNQNGVAVTNGDMIGKLCVVNYFFTTCKGICPRMNNNLKTIYEAFKDEPDFLILSHSCDPERDSVPRIKHYADSLKVDTRKWIFLTGRKDSLYKMARFSYGVDDPKNAVNDIKDDFCIHNSLR